MEPQGADDFRYVYKLLDHLGNNRVSFTKNDTTEELDVLQTNDYYPFGLEHGKENIEASSSNLGENWKFNGVERNADTEFYEMDFRQYNPSIGRFTSVDPLSEERNWVSTYNFAQNNPILRVDPTGFWIGLYNRKQPQYVWDENVTDC